MKYRTAETPELVHGDLCGSITPAMPDGRNYFILLVDDYSRYIWLQLLTSKTEAAEAVKKFKARAEAESGKKLRVLRRSRCGATPHHAVLATIEWCGGAAEPDGGRHGSIHDEGKSMPAKF